ncbi:MAG: hypothetical protein RMK29_07770 [Myxococcales bacterium]|nr:hypothetical protein [Myxococcota bacterium]MDW8281592.1 hypothetical protein [Myxococcales bacterium]
MRLSPVLIALLLGLANPAHAQGNQYGPYDPYVWSVYNEGPGIKFFHDGLVFHPGLSTELGYDSNVLLATPAADAGMLRLRLHLDLATLPPQRSDGNYKPKLVFRAGGMFEYRQYFSRDERVGTVQQLNGLSNIDLAIRPHDPLSLYLYNNLIVTNDTRNLEVATRETFAPRLFWRFGLLGVFRPGNGPLELGLGDAVRLDYYISDDLSRNRSFGNEATLYAQLRVLPQTTVKLEVRSSYITYYESSDFLPNAVPLRIIAAANSLLLPALGVSAFAGYGNSLQLGAEQIAGLTRGTAPNYNNFVGGAELRLRLLAQMRLALGWARDFYDSIFATYLADDRLYLNYEHYIWRGLAAQLRFETYFRQYGALAPWRSLGFQGYRVGNVECNDLMPGPCTLSRSDIILNLAAELKYRVRSWMELGVSYSLLNDITDFRFVVVPGSQYEDAAFIKHMVLGKVDIAY